MKAIAAAMILFLLPLCVIPQENRVVKNDDPVHIADRYFYARPEGNLGIEIAGKFQSEEILKATLDLSAEIGVHKAKKYPFDETMWTLRDILVSVDFNANGSVAVWRVSGPKPLLLNYLERLKNQYEDKSLFYDFGHRFINFRPSTD
ncbi:MAG TPA: hypothetical protein VJ810_40810 [Blastocatellia bacterium]|nr:hypothetical protein [Blastocatellia bacterium]